MIRTVADLLQEIMKKEREILDREKISHPPTIGAMYEGLTREILDMPILKELDIKIVEGFACFGDELSGQLDCMIVRGSGVKIPKTESYKWPISDVIAVLEVKKTLTADNLSDSYDHLKKVLDIHSSHTSSNRSEKLTEFKIDVVDRIFSMITGASAPLREEISSLPFDIAMIYHTIVAEYVTPVRIVVGHHSWKKEVTLRENFAKLLQDRSRARPRGMGVNSFPQLIVGGECSLVKANGFPYITQLIDGAWPFYLSTTCNPLRIMLELILSKIDFMLGTKLAHDNDIEHEALAPFLQAKAVKDGERVGWHYIYNSISQKDLENRGKTFSWSPSEITPGQAAIFHALCRGEQVCTTDQSYANLAKEEGVTVIEFTDLLIKTLLISVNKDKLVLNTQQCAVVCTPDGKILVGENNTGQLEEWLRVQYKISGP